MSMQEKRLFVAMELSNNNWKLVLGDGSRERERTVPAGREDVLLEEVKLAKAKLGLMADAAVVFCYEAGRDGFWIDRMLRKNGFQNHVMDPSSIEVPRRARTRKTDRLDAKKLLGLLIRKEEWKQEKAFSSVRVPTEEEEAAMRIGRERERLVAERTGHRCRIKSLPVLHGIKIHDPVRVKIEELRDWEGKPLPEVLVEELKREQERLRLLEEQIKGLEKQQEASMERPKTAAQQKAVKLSTLKGIGKQSSWLLSHECFGWRTFANRKHLGSFVGLTGTPYDSGETMREQGISKAGSGRVRTAMIELAWNWVRWQPKSALTNWFIEQYVRAGTKRNKRKGIVALARKLLIALWKYVEHGVVPEGAILRA